MKNVVVILGAGASAPFGVPTLLKVFKDPFARRHLHNDRWLHNQLIRLFWRPRGHDLETSNLGLSVEEILTVVRDYENQAYGVDPILPGDDTERFKRSLYVLIKKAVFDGKHSRHQYLNPLIHFLRRDALRVTWASFNWDCIFEASYYYSSGDVYRNRYNPRVVVDLRNWFNSSGHTFLKLHGGVNWWYENKTLLYLPFGGQPELNEKWDLYERNETDGHPVILEPSYYKYDDPVYDLLKDQWDVFVQRLSTADLVVVIGYSLPEADYEARRALTIGFQDNPDAKFVVIDHADWVCNRYKRLIGTKRLLTVKSKLEDVHEKLPDKIREYMELA